MGLRDFTRSGTFVLLLLAAVVVGVPFGIEQIGETTGFYRFPVVKTVKGWFGGSASGKGGSSAVKPVEWERYRRDLEAFTEWAEGRRTVTISLPRGTNDVIRLPVEELSPQRKVWSVPITSCTSGDPMRDRKGYVFISGFDRCFKEGDVIKPTEDRCGYEIAFVGDRAVWFRAIFESESADPMGPVKLPDFNRIGKDFLVIGTRKYVVRDAFPLESGGWLTIDDFLPPDGVLFKLRDERREVKATILCVVISEKGGR